MRITLIIGLAAFTACGDAAPSNDPATSTTSADTSVATTADTSLGDVAVADTDDTTMADSSVADSAIVDSSVADTSADETSVDDTSIDASDVYLAHCESLFAAGVALLAAELDPSFPSDCDATFSAPVGRLKQNGKPLCNAGETANACRTRLYETPPAMSDLDQACWNGSGPAGCMHGSWLARCADGSDACAEDEVVCQDGMRPMLYAEAASAGTLPSDVWWFHMGGEGGPCTGAVCWGNYRFGEAEFARAMSSLHPGGPSSAATRPGGVLSGDPSTPYARINHVRFERCTDAASDRPDTDIVPVADGVPAEFLDQFPGATPATRYGEAPVWYRGFATWRAAFHQMTTAAGRDRDGDGTPEMPSLADARLVVISASSDASMWLTFAADALAAELRSIAGPDLEVRMAVDGMFPPMLDNQGRYHVDASGVFEDMLSTPYSETGLCQLADNHDELDNESCSGATFDADGGARTSIETRGLVRDASCDAFHGAGAPECFDRNHVLVHHVDMPVLVLADQEDNTVSDNGPLYGDRSYLFEEPSAYRRLIVDAGWDIVDHWSTEAREEGAGVEGDFVLVLPKTRREGEPWARATHVRFGSDDEMAHMMTLCTSGGAKVATRSYNDLMAGWLTNALPGTIAIEDASRTLPNGNYWVTGSTCRAAE